jgi:hypothetical protein
VQGDLQEEVNHPQQEYARGEGHEHRAECLVSLLTPYRRVVRGIRKTTLVGDVGCCQFLRNFHQQNACEQAERSLQAALEPGIARRAKRGEFVMGLDHCNLRQTARN